MIGFETRTVVVNREVVEIELEVDDRPRSLGLAVRVDGDKRWSSEEPGWRDIGCGVAEECVYVWSARRLVIVPLDSGEQPCSIDAAEDIVLVFKIGRGWLLACETSLLLVVSGCEPSRLALSDVLDDARWAEDSLIARSQDGSCVRVVVRGDALIEEPSD